MTDEKTNCVPCAIGIPVAIADHICKLTDDKECAELQTDLINKKISIDQYFDKVGKILEEKKVDEGFMTTFNNARKVYDSVKAKREDPGK